ncbi:hypothetical protein Tco_0478555 [Tanacetum coccineum]
MYNDNISTHPLETYPQRQVAQDTTDLSLRKMANVVVYLCYILLPTIYISINLRSLVMRGTSMMVLLKIFLAEKYGLRSENVEVKQNGIIYKTATSIVGRLIAAATSYFLWCERNDRIHGKGDKKVEQVSKYVADSVRLKPASIKFKKNARVGTSHRCKGADYALESIDNMKEAIPELWELVDMVSDALYNPAKVVAETSVTA